MMSECLPWDHKVMYLNVVCSITLAVTPYLKYSKNYILFTYFTLGLESLVAKDELDLQILQTSPQGRATTPGLRLHLSRFRGGKGNKTKLAKTPNSRHPPHFAQHACVSAGFRNDNQSSSRRKKIGGGFFKPTGQSRPSVPLYRWWDTDGLPMLGGCAAVRGRSSAEPRCWWAQ